MQGTGFIFHATVLARIINLAGFLARNRDLARLLARNKILQVLLAALNIKTATWKQPPYLQYIWYGCTKVDSYSHDTSITFPSHLLLVFNPPHWVTCTSEFYPNPGSNIILYLIMLSWWHIKQFFLNWWIWQKFQNFVSQMSLVNF